ncbi:hypothetical protein C1H46_031508 [Malus baccata]|uniref:Uncharacterized protein n=1 Tax=Malus baccata TaxID=106549 RepID=A0A540L8X5_MALBA|nr:hypothetical protein C1H46_031508 [Malus baccata]
MNGSVKVNGLDLGGLSACYITLRAWKLDGRCTELSVKAHALKGQECVHCRLIVRDGYVTIRRGESIRRFFEHAEEAEEEEDDDSMDKDGNELDGECSRPQKHAKSPELAREFLLDAATVIFKEQASACSILCSTYLPCLPLAPFQFISQSSTDRSTLRYLPRGYMPSKEQTVTDSPLKCSDHVENDQACYKKEATIEEYNLFAASNGIRFQFF